MGHKEETRDTMKLNWRRRRARSCKQGFAIESSDCDDVKIMENKLTSNKFSKPCTTRTYEARDGDKK